MDARLREGISLFNTRRFFESHEAWEQFYQDTTVEVDKGFVEGLIQLAAALRLYTEFGEVKGPVRMVYQALIRFENYQPAFLNIKVRQLCEEMEAWAKQTEASGSPDSSREIPKIRLQRFGLFS
jgi:predicted metal-dependent hydrolase